MRVIFLALGLLSSFLSAHAVARPLVAIIDSGIAQTAELQPLLVGEFDMAGNRPAFQPRYDHGTMVATILAREAKSQVDIVSLRIDDPAGCPADRSPPCQPDAAPLARAIDKAASLGVAAINISLALKDHPVITEAIRRAAHKGILVVLAAGNDGYDQPSNMSMAVAGYPQAVLVGALDAAGEPWAGTNRPESSRVHNYIYVWRRGVDVPTASAVGAATTGTGTSFAVPIETARRLMQLATPAADGTASTGHLTQVRTRG